MQSKVTEEGARDAKLYEKYMCYCTNGAGDLAKSIGSADTKIPQVESSIEEAKAQKAQLEADLVAHKADRAAAKEATAKATALREKEATVYAKESSDYKTNIAALGGAVTALEKGMSGGAFLQTSAANVIRKLTIDMDLSSVDRDVLSSFLAEGQNSNCTSERTDYRHPQGDEGHHGKGFERLHCCRGRIDHEFQRARCCQGKGNCCKYQRN